MVELSGCNSSEDDVVISGIGGRFPLSENMAELEYHLFNKTPMVKNVEDLNWQRDDLDVPDCIGRMKDLNKFDTSYFGISPIMTKHMDPMTRITLETTFEAIVDSEFWLQTVGPGGRMRQAMTALGEAGRRCTGSATQTAVAEIETYSSNYIGAVVIFATMAARSLRGGGALNHFLMDELISFMDDKEEGNNPVDLKNTQTSIFVGSNISDSESTWLFIGATENGFSIIGHNRSMLANRVSYWLNTNGPSYAYVTNETAGLDGITMAYEAIKAGRCVGAVVGTVNLVMHPESLYQHNKMNLLSKDGQCRSFDADCRLAHPLPCLSIVLHFSLSYVSPVRSFSFHVLLRLVHTHLGCGLPIGDGFARSDSCVVLYLQKARDAKRIYATVVHSDKEFFGDRKAGLVRPLDDPLISLLTRFYDKCGIDPSEIVFLEANGCGVKNSTAEDGEIEVRISVYDEEEFKAIEKVLLSRRQTPLLVGSVKSNLGHSDAASALCSVAKVLIAMETGYIPPNLNYNKPASFIPALLDGRIKVMTEKTKWDGGLVALNSIGVTGSYAHTLLRSYTKEKLQDNNPKDGVPRIVCVSGRTEEGITKVIDKVAEIKFIRTMVPQTLRDRIRNEKVLQEIQLNNQSVKPLLPHKVEMVWTCKEDESKESSKRMTGRKEICRLTKTKNGSLKRSNTWKEEAWSDTMS
uniref:(California timema) hypothetical protein n=1 Tax=Timema californicum TaxID=61474 RepID=A0A7R9PAS2_TIMCA|nr:unnamed protein product [Timema californicum]